MKIGVRSKPTTAVDMERKVSSQHTGAVATSSAQPMQRKQTLVLMKKMCIMDDSILPQQQRTHFAPASVGLSSQPPSSSTSMGVVITAKPSQQETSSSKSQKLKELKESWGMLSSAIGGFAVTAGSALGDLAVTASTAIGDLARKKNSILAGKPPEFEGELPEPERGDIVVFPHVTGDLTKAWNEIGTHPSLLISGPLNIPDMNDGLHPMRRSKPTMPTFSSHLISGIRNGSLKAIGTVRHITMRRQIVPLWCMERRNSHSTGSSLVTHRCMRMCALLMMRTHV